MHFAASCRRLSHDVRYQVFALAMGRAEEEGAHTTARCSAAPGRSLPAVPSDRYRTVLAFGQDAVIAAPEGGR